MAASVKIDPLTGEVVEAAKVASSVQIDPKTGEVIEKSVSKIKIDPATGEVVGDDKSELEPNLGFNHKQKRSPAESFAPSAKTDEVRAVENAAIEKDRTASEKVGMDFRAAREKRNEERRKATAENLKFSNVSTPTPVPGALTTPGQYAEDVTGVPRGESVAGKAATSIGDAGDALVNVTSVPLLNLLRGKTYDQRMGEKVLEAEAGLKGQAAVRSAKMRAAKGTATDDDQKAIESDKFLNKLHSAYQAVKENPGEAASSLLVGVLEDAPLYILSAPIGGEAIKLAGNVAKEGAAAIRLANLAKKIGTEAATAAEATSAATRATEAALVRSPAGLGHIAEKTAEDMVGNVAVGATTSQSRGQKYDAAQLAQDLVASAGMAAGGTLAHALRDGRPLSAAEFHDLQKAVDVAGIHEHPQILELLPQLKAAASDEKFVSEGGRIRLEKDGKPLTHAEAVASGYGEEFLKKLGITEESPGEATGSTTGRDITLYGGADPSTLSEEMTHFWQNVNAEKAANDPEGPHVALEQDIRDWANTERARTDAPLPESDVELFGKAYEGTLEGVEVPADLKEKFEGLKNVEVPEAATEITPELKAPEEISAETPAAVAAPTIASIRAAKKTETPEFKNWFGDSKVVDDEGKPLVVYHGSAADIEAFKAGDLKSGIGSPDGRLGIFFSNDPNTASRYANDVSVDRSYGYDADGNYTFPDDAANAKAKAEASGAGVYPTHIKMEKPLIFDVKAWENSPAGAGQDFMPAIKGKEVLRAAKKQGYDGVIFKNIEDEFTHGFMDPEARAAGNMKPQDYYVVFDPTQIKSAIGNNGAFDPKDPRINYQLRAGRDTPARAEQDRLAAVKTLKIMLESPGMGAKKSAAKAGLSGPEAEAAAERAVRIRRDMGKTGSYEDALAKDALRDMTTKPPSETLKQTILRSTGEGITGKEIITAKSALHDVIRRLASEAKLDDRIGRAKAETAAVRAEGAARLATQRQAIKDALEIRKALSEETRDLLPPEMRGRMVASVAGAKTPHDLEVGLQKIADILDDHEHSEAVKGLQDLLKGTNPKFLRPEYRDKFVELTKSIDPRPLSDKEENRLWKLADWYERAQESGDNPDLEAIPASELEKLKRLDQTRIADMNVDEIREVADLVQQILHQNELKNTLIGARDTRVYEKTVNDATEQIVKANPSEAKEGSGVMDYIKSAAGMESLSPEVVSRFIGGDNGVIHDVTYKQPAIAKSLAYRMENGARGVLKAFFESKGMTGEKLIDWRNEKVKVPLESGQEVELTRPQLVSLYATVQNSENLDAVLNNGLISENAKGIIGKEFKVTRDDLKNITASMDEFDIKTAETMMTIFEGLRPLMNEASVKLEGYEKYTRPRYFPRTADRGFMNRNLTELGKFWRGGALENLGIGKDIKKHKLPFVLMDATQVFDRHIYDASMYSEMAVPIRNALRVVGNAEVGSAMKKHVGKNSVRDIEDFLVDISGMKSFDLTSSEKLVNELARTFAAGKLGWRPTTIANNLIGAPLQVLAELDGKQSAAFLKNMGSTGIKELRSLFEEMMVLDGYFEQRYGQDPYQIAVFGGRKHVESVGNSKVWARLHKIQDKAMAPIQDAEKLAGINLYKTLAEVTTREQAVKGMEGFYGKNGFDPSDPDLIKKYAANETMMIVRRTQNAIDDLDKSKFARSLTDRPLAASMFMFTSQLFKLRDMAVMAYMDLKRAGGMSAPAADKAKFARSMGLIVTSAALVPTAASLAMREVRNGFREKDEREEDKRWGAAMAAAFNLADVVHPAFGGASRVVAGSLMGKGFSGGRGGFITESLDGAAKGAHALFEGDWEKAYKNILPAVAITGAPIEGPAQVLEGFYKMATDGDPALPIMNERYLLKKQFGANKDGTPRSVNEAVRDKAISPKEGIRYQALDKAVTSYNARKKAEDAGRIQKGSAEKYLETAKAFLSHSSIR